MKALRLASAALLLGLLLHPAVAHAQPKAEASKVRVLLVLDTDDQMGATWGLDGDNVRLLVEHMVKKQGLEGRVTIDHFTGDKCSPKVVLDYYNKLDTNEDEALFFYFSGHGGYTKAKGHFMAFTRGPLFRKDLLTAMDKRKPRLRVVLTDCCANDIASPPPRGGGIKAAQDRGQRRPPIEEPAGNRQSNEPPGQEFPLHPGLGERPATKKALVQEPPFTVGRGVDIRTAKGKIAFEELLEKTDGKVLRDLLFRHVGLIDINGCKIGAVSMGTSEWGGSVFTNAFLLLMTEPAGKLGAKMPGDAVSWEAFYPRWQKTTDQLARAYTNGQASQVPEAFQLGEKK
jgi:hypothetical protein